MAIRLDEQDWAELMAGKAVQVGKKILTVRPYTLGELVHLKQVFLGMKESLQKEGFTAETLESEGGLARIFDFVAANCPVLIELATGLDREDVPKLPLAVGLAIVTQIINVNLESQEGLHEALGYLGKLLAR